MAFQDLSRMGMRPAGSGAGPFLEGIIAAAEAATPAYRQAKYDKMRDEKAKVDMYTSLRNAGYSKDEAYDKTLKKMGMEKPAGDVVDLDREKEELAIKSKRLDIEKKEHEKEQGWDKDKKPSWKQEQLIESLRDGLSRGKVVIGKEFGEPSVYEIKTQEDAMNAIAEAGFDVDMFSTELKQYEDVMMKNPKGETVSIPRNKVEQAKKAGYVEVAMAEQEYSTDEEELIKANMDYYKKSREEVIRALKKQGHLKK